MSEQNDVKTPGQVAYEEDVRRKPFYEDGTARKTWNQLSEVARWDWNRKPYPRNWGTQVSA